MSECYCVLGGQQGNTWFDTCTAANFELLLQPSDLMILEITPTTDIADLIISNAEIGDSYFLLRISASSTCAAEPSEAPVFPAMGVSLAHLVQGLQTLEADASKTHFLLAFTELMLATGLIP